MDGNRASPQRFHFEINSIGDFLLFVNLIRNQDMDPVALQTLVDKLKASSDELEQAVENQSK